MIIKLISTVLSEDILGVPAVIGRRAGFTLQVLAPMLTFRFTRSLSIGAVGFPLQSLTRHSCNKSIRQFTQLPKDK